MQIARSGQNCTQWAGQFGVAHELCRRGYLVTFTMGNAPEVDLLCRSPKGKDFAVQVKSLSSKTSFIFGRGVVDDKRDECNDLYFVFVLLPQDHLERAEYYVVNRGDTKEAL